MNSTEPVLLTSADGVTTITLNRPERKNAIDEPTWNLLKDVLQQVRNDPHARAVVLQGAGGDFCAGADVAKSEHNEHPIPRLRRIGDVALALFDLPMPVIAKVDGVAAGAGCNMALACDFVVASSHARFTEIFTRRALSIDFGGSWLLPRIVGLQQAKRLALLAEVIDANEAQRLGMVTWVQPAEELDAFVADLAKRVAGLPPVAVGQTKALLNQWRGRGPSRRDPQRSRCSGGQLRHRGRASCFPGLPREGRPAPLHRTMGRVMQPASIVRGTSWTS